MEDVLYIVTMKIFGHSNYLLPLILSGYINNKIYLKLLINEQKSHIKNVQTQKNM